MPSLPPDDQPTTCVLAHRGFAMFGEPLFRRAETDSTPVMVVTLGERLVSLPLRSLQREFAIEDDTPDGRMLGLIAEAMDFVSILRIGDALPSEVCTGEASWEPDASHLALVSTRLRVQLVAWLNVGSSAEQPELSAEALLRLADEPVMRRQVQDALDHASTALGVGSQAAVVELLEDLAHELAFIEALRDRLLRPIQVTVQKIEQLVRARRGDGSQMETVTQVRRLIGLALKDLTRRFDELDAQTGEVMATLRNANSQRSFIRTNRDWLYRTQRAWQPILSEWESVQAGSDEGSRALLTLTYRFLAPRYMPVTEWLSPARPKSAKATTPQMTW